MLNGKRRKIGLGLAVIFVFIISMIPIRVSGDVQPIEEMEEKLEGISEEEKSILQDLFMITQEIEKMEREEEEIMKGIASLQVEITEMEQEIDDKKKDYDTQLDILKQVLVQYQRGGPATYLEILLHADNLTMFLKSINMIKDISRNTGELLTSLEEGKRILEAERTKLNDSLVQLEQKKAEQQEKLIQQLKLKEEQEVYLASLKEEQEHYQEQLSNLEQMWDDSKNLFAEIVNEISEIIGSGYFTAEDLNLRFTFTQVQGSIDEEVFNKKLKEHSSLPEVIFHFGEEQVKIEVPEKHLTLQGKFVIESDTAIRFEAMEGSFYEMPLESSALEELFINGPLIIDFKMITGDAFIFNFILDQMKCQDGSITFLIKIAW